MDDFFFYLPIALKLTGESGYILSYIFKTLLKTALVLTEKSGYILIYIFSYS